ncbi:cytochrome P450 9e2-like [Leptinotarsa decemlineata]|uniref:cytochrome P450 9e2-like n=1 Tax=Leptinotarsa decemlineata TaxID=7539 RepID=UPI003D306407
MIQLFLGAAALAAIFYYFYIKPWNYWRERGVKQEGHPIQLYIDSKRQAIIKNNVLDRIVGYYNQFQGTRYHGIYQMSAPTLVIKDPELLRRITVKDFDHFTDHKSFIALDIDPLWSKNLFFSKGPQWRKMRPILSPSFTSSKLRKMFVLISKCTEDFVNHFLKKDEKCIEIEMKDAFTRFTNDVIATSAFGVEVDSLKEPDNEFYSMGKKLTDVKNSGILFKYIGYPLVPKLIKYLGITYMNPAANRFFSDLVDNTIEVREKNNIIRPDMIHLLMEARKGEHHKEENSDIDTGFATAKKADLGKGQATELTNSDITAQALLFFFAGFDTVSSLMCFMSHELAIHPDIQTRLRNEIEDTLAECGGKITYEALLKMKYMDMVISESLRKWPSTVSTDRVCTKPYTIEAKNADEKPLHIEKGITLMIPMVGIHYDPKYYPNPERFDPERFSDENKGKIDPFTYMPFGLGPRICIGSRFALLETKLLFFHLLSHFELVPVEKTQIPLKLSTWTVNLMAENGFWLGLKRLQK